MDMDKKFKSQLERLKTEIAAANAELVQAAKDYETRRHAAQKKLSTASGQLAMLVDMLPNE